MRVTVFQKNLPKPFEDDAREMSSVIDRHTLVSWLREGGEFIIYMGSCSTINSTRKGYIKAYIISVYSVARRSAEDLAEADKKNSKINIEIRRSTTPGKRVILVQGPC